MVPDLGYENSRIMGSLTVLYAILLCHGEELHKKTEKFFSSHKVIA